MSWTEADVTYEKGEHRKSNCYTVIISPHSERKRDYFKYPTLIVPLFGYDALRGD